MRLNKHIFSLLAVLMTLFSIPSGFAQSPQATIEWALFTQILYIGIVVGIIVFGLLFYAIIRYREKTPKKAGAT